MKKLTDWSEYLETPVSPAGTARLNDSEKVSLLRKLGISASTEKARANFMLSRRLKG